MIFGSNKVHKLQQNGKKFVCSARFAEISQVVVRWSGIHLVLRIMRPFYPLFALTFLRQMNLLIFIDKASSEVELCEYEF